MKLSAFTEDSNKQNNNFNVDGINMFGIEAIEHVCGIHRIKLNLHEISLNGDGTASHQRELSDDATEKSSKIYLYRVG